MMAWREWRYRAKPLRLLSLAFGREWPLGGRMMGEPDVPGYGIYALKERPERWGWEHIASAGPYDGYVIGKVALSGTVWEHERGYLAQYARPMSFEEAQGLDSAKVLNVLRLVYL
jgi:hypothetical protein